MYIVFFFFSSRRRHTRSLCDWSSDVCSSDLEARLLGQVEEARLGKRTFLRDDRIEGPARHQLGRDPGEPRSEERRVGKECRARWSAYHKKKKNTKEWTLS